MNDAIALDARSQATASALEQAGAGALIAVAGALQFSIAVAQILLAIALVCWLALLDRAPRALRRAAFLLAARSPTRGITLVSAALSPDPRASLIDCKQLVLFLLVPAHLPVRQRGRGRTTLLTVVVTCARGQRRRSASCSTASCTTTTSASGRRARSATT